MRLEFVDDTGDGDSDLPEPASLKDYSAWAKIHYGLMEYLAKRFPDLKVSNLTSVQADIWYSDDWFEVRQTAVVAASWHGFSLTVARAIQEYIRLAAPDWLVTYGVESVLETEIGVLQVEVTISANRAWVRSFDRSAKQTRKICLKSDAFSWLVDHSGSP